MQADKSRRQSLKNWLCNTDYSDLSTDSSEKKIDWLRVIPFLLLHLSCFAVFLVGFSWTAFYIALGLYLVRLFAIGGFYHRYFSHRTFKTNRFWQFIFAAMGASAVQRGPIWWAAHHRQHHLVSDQAEDAHSPVQNNFWWSHMGWFMSKKHYGYDKKRVKDWLRYPEICLIDRYDILVPCCLAISLFITGCVLAHVAPQLHTNGWQLLVWGFCLSTIVTFHVTVSINSLSHRFGKKRYPTQDNSRNHWLLALITLGEGWHNNHHHYPQTARQGFRWWEIDITYYLLKLMEKARIISQVKGLPKKIAHPSSPTS